MSVYINVQWPTVIRCCSRGPPPHIQSLFGFKTRPPSPLPSPPLPRTGLMIIARRTALKAGLAEQANPHKSCCPDVLRASIFSAQRWVRCRSHSLFLSLSLSRSICGSLTHSSHSRSRSRSLAVRLLGRGACSFCFPKMNPPPRLDKIRGRGVRDLCELLLSVINSSCASVCPSMCVCVCVCVCHKAVCVQA